MFQKKEDIEISGFFASTFAWGLRKTIISKSKYLMELMDNSPYEFTINASKSELDSLSSFTHRTFNSLDCKNYILNLRNLYFTFGNMDNCMKFCLSKKKNIKESIGLFRNTFFLKETPTRTLKHFANPLTDSACKRFWLFLRWMVRKDTNEVDFGIWKSLKPMQLLCPLDLHVGNTARNLGILSRNYNDWLAAEELTACLKLYDSIDPVKYDFALFGLGIKSKIT